MKDHFDALDVARDIVRNAMDEQSPLAKIAGWVRAHPVESIALAIIAYLLLLRAEQSNREAQLHVTVHHLPAVPGMQAGPLN